MNLQTVAHRATAVSVVTLVAMVPLATIIAADLMFKWDLLPPFPEKVAWLVVIFLSLNFAAAWAIGLLADLQRQADASSRGRSPTLEGGDHV